MRENKFTDTQIANGQDRSAQFVLTDIWVKGNECLFRAERLRGVYPCCLQRAIKYTYKCHDYYPTNA